MTYVKTILRLLIKTLYGKATRTPTVIGAATLAKANPTPVTLVLYKKKPQGRHKLTRRGTTAQWTNSKLAAEREREPWLFIGNITKVIACFG